MSLQYYIKNGLLKRSKVLKRHYCSTDLELQFSKKDFLDKLLIVQQDRKQRIMENLLFMRCKQA